MVENKRPMYLKMLTFFGALIIAVMDWLIIRLEAVANNNIATKLANTSMMKREVSL